MVYASPDPAMAGARRCARAVRAAHPGSPVVRGGRALRTQCARPGPAYGGRDGWLVCAGPGRQVMRSRPASRRLRLGTGRRTLTPRAVLLRRRPRRPLAARQVGETPGRRQRAPSRAAGPSAGRRGSGPLQARTGCSRALSPVCRRKSPKPRRAPPPRSPPGRLVRSRRRGLGRPPRSPAHHRRTDGSVLADTGFPSWQRSPKSRPGRRSPPLA